MTVKRYRKRPAEIEALQWTGDNGAEIQTWCGDYFFKFADSDGSAALYVMANSAWLDIEISEWVAKDSIGFYPIKDSMFKKSYDPV